MARDRIRYNKKDVRLPMLLTLGAALLLLIMLLAAVPRIFLLVRVSGLGLRGLSRGGLYPGLSGVFGV